jgi:hypothetical protein
MTAVIGLLVCLVVTPGLARGQTRLPELAVEAPEALAATAEQIRRLDQTRLANIVTLTGLADPGPPIRVVLVPERTAIARDTPAWIAAFADARRDLVVLFPDRIGSYPYDSLETVLHHEVAHVLAARAAGGGAIPRWFNEGLASAAERTWGLEARSRFVWEMLAGNPMTPAELEGLFTQGSRDVARAYVLSERLVRDLLEEHGAGTAARILAGMARGAPFEVALYAATGSSVDTVMRSFRNRHAVWESWIGAAGHPFTQWVLITSLALVAIWRHRRRRRERRRLWELEEQAEAEAWEQHRHRYRTH